MFLCPVRASPNPSAPRVAHRPNGYSHDMTLLLLAAVIIAVAFGIGALVHFLWLGLIVLAVVFVVSFFLRSA
jgi:hypothetical protein